jgi:CRP-like cAMP-binding protein
MNFRISEGITRVNLAKLSYYLKDKGFRRRDAMFREGDLGDGIYFIKDGEFEVTKSLKTRLEKTTITKGHCSLLKTIEIKVSIIGANQIIGLEDMVKNADT